MPAALRSHDFFGGAVCPGPGRPLRALLCPRRLGGPDAVPSKEPVPVQVTSPPPPRYCIIEHRPARVLLLLLLPIISLFFFPSPAIPARGGGAAYFARVKRTRRTRTVFWRRFRKRCKIIMLYAWEGFYIIFYHHEGTMSIYAQHNIIIP